MRLPRRTALPLAAAVLAAIAIPAVAAQQSTPAPLPALPSVTPPFAATAPVVGAVDPATRVDFAVELTIRNAATLKATALAMSTPGNKAFRHFLTRAQRQATYDPTSAQTATVKAGLQALGVTVDGVTSDGRVLVVHAPAGTITSALGVSFSRLRTPQGAVERVAMSQPQLPSALKPLVANIYGLTETPAHPDLHGADSGPVGVTTDAAPAYYVGQPCSGYFGEKTSTDQPAYQGTHPVYTICGYNPTQVRAAYRVPESGLDGSGTNIGVVDDYSVPTVVADTNTLSDKYGLPHVTFVDNSVPGASNPPETTVNDDDPIIGVGSLPLESPQEWSGEQTLDIEAVHTMAPKATIQYYGGVQGLGLQPLEVAFSQLIADDKVTYVSDSWGTSEQSVILTPADFQAMDTALAMGATEGIGAGFSSGDDADEIEASGVRQADFPESEDMATSVGGTTLVVSANNSYVGETYWGTRLEPKTADGSGWDATPTVQSPNSGTATGPGSLAGGGGGGVSDHYAEPTWQKGVVPDSLTTQSDPNNAVTSPGRVVPDISLLADSTTGILVGQTQTQKDGSQAYSEYRIGGTSVSSPLMGGLVALATQKNGGKSLGFLNPAMYAAFKKSPAGFRDPSLGNTLTNVRVDHVDTQDPNSAPKYALRLLGQLSSLHDLVGYDDATGLGSPCSPVFVAAIIAPTVQAPAVSGCGLPLPGEVSSPVVTAPKVTSTLRIGGRGPITLKHGKAKHTYTVLLFSDPVRGTFASPAGRKVALTVNGKKVTTLTTVRDKKNPYLARATFVVHFSKKGTYKIGATFAGATDIAKSSARAQKVRVS